MFLKEEFGIQIPQRIADIIHGPMGADLGTRSSDLEPCFEFCFGARVSADRESLTIYILEPGSEQTMANLNHNGQMAVIVSVAGEHESYQLKGEFIAARSSSETDYAIQKIWLEKMMPSMPPHLLPHLARIRTRPTLAVEMRIRDLFEQTPGPGTGGPVHSDKEGA